MYIYRAISQLIGAYYLLVSIDILFLNGIELGNYT